METKEFLLPLYEDVLEFLAGDPSITNSGSGATC